MFTKKSENKIKSKERKSEHTNKHMVFIYLLRELKTELLPQIPLAFSLKR